MAYPSSSSLRICFQTAVRLTPSRRLRAPPETKPPSASSSSFKSSVPSIRFAAPFLAGKPIRQRPKRFPLVGPASGRRFLEEPAQQPADPRSARTLQMPGKISAVNRQIADFINRHLPQPARGFVKRLPRDGKKPAGQRQPVLHRGAAPVDHRADPRLPRFRAVQIPENRFEPPVHADGALPSFSPGAAYAQGAGRLFRAALVRASGNPQK